VQLEHEVVPVRGEFDLQVAIARVCDEELDDFILPESIGRSRWAGRGWVAEVRRIQLDDQSVGCALHTDLRTMRRRQDSPAKVPLDR
jgi:hypothetical protein